MASSAAGKKRKVKHGMSAGAGLNAEEETKSRDAAVVRTSGRELCQCK